ncbi:MAG: alpha/beta fold hydrolase [Planctomycetota bacterium]
MPSQRVYFPNSKGDRLAGIVDLPSEDPVGFALFAHCFTCTKDLKAIVRVSRGLAKQGIGVLRFDFTGLGDSHGDFSESNFESNVSDIHSAANWLSENHQPAAMFVGHSLGGTALMSTMNRMDSARSLVTLASPANTHHLVDTLLRLNPNIEKDHEGEVVIGGRTHLIKTQLLQSLRRQQMKPLIESIQIPHLVLHSPDDEMLAIQHAHDIFEMSGGYKAFVTLPGSDHLLVNQPEDVGFVSNLIASWGKRFM